MKEKLLQELTKIADLLASEEANDGVPEDIQAFHDGLTLRLRNLVKNERKAAA